MITKSYFTEIKSAAIIVLVTMIAAVVAQATVINIDRDQLGSWPDIASSKGGGVAFHALAESAGEIYEDRSITLRPVCNKEQIWYGSGSVIGDDVLVGCQGSKNKGGISAEEITPNIVGQFSNSDGSRASFSQFDIGKGSAKGSGRYAGISDNESLKAVLKSCGEDHCTDRYTQFAYDCYDRGNRGRKGGHHQPEDGGDDNSNPEIPEPSTLAVFAMASLCFLVKRRNRLSGRF